MLYGKVLHVRSKKETRNFWITEQPLNGTKCRFILILGNTRFFFSDLFFFNLVESNCAERMQSRNGMKFRRRNVFRCWNVRVFEQTKIAPSNDFLKKFLLEFTIVGVYVYILANN